MVPASNLLALLGVGLAGVGAVHVVRDRHRRGRTGSARVATGLVTVGLVLVGVSTAGALTSNVAQRVLLPAVLATAGLVGVASLLVGTLRDDARLATVGYWFGSSLFAVPVVLVGRDLLTVVIGTAATLLFAGMYGGLAERTPARTVTAGSRE